MNVINITLWIVAGVTFIVALALILINYNKSKKYKIRAEVYEIDNLGRVVPYYDKYGIIFNKVLREKMGHLLKSNLWVGLDSENYQTIRLKKMFGMQYIKVVRLIKMQGEGLAFLTPQIIGEDGKQQTTFKLRVNPESVGWATHSYNKWKQTISMQSRMKEMLAMGLMIIALVFVLAVAIMLIKEIPTLSEALTEVSHNLVSSAESIKSSIAMQQGVIQ